MASQSPSQCRGRAGEMAGPPSRLARLSFSGDVATIDATSRATGSRSLPHPPHQVLRFENPSVVKPKIAGDLDSSRCLALEWSLLAFLRLRALENGLWPVSAPNTIPDSVCRGLARCNC